MGVRHYQTTSKRVNGVTYRSTRSRGFFWGPYQTEAQKSANIVGIAVVVGLFTAGAWPWDVSMPDIARIPIAIGSLTVAVMILLVLVDLHRRFRHR